MLSNIIFYLGIGLLFTHELDAIQHHEWRLFAFLRPFNDTMSFQIFTLAHVPLFILFLWLVANPVLWVMLLVDIFMIVHVGLHFMFRSNPNYEFQGWFSHGIIVGAGLMGALHLVLLALYELIK